MQSPITVSGVSFEFPNGHPIFKNLNFTLGPGVTGLVGPNGVGKTTLARLLSGELKPSSGTIHTRSTPVFLRQREPAPDIAAGSWLGRDLPSGPMAVELLGSLDLTKPCSQLSGGEWMRVRLARFLNAGFLILDEPTNDLDREARETLIGFLRAHRGGILLISHDREALGICASIVELSNKGLSKFGAGWNEYLREKSAERARLEARLGEAKRAREAAHRERVEKSDRQQRRNRRGLEAAARGGMPKILIGGRKRRAQVTTGNIDKETSARAEGAVRSAFEAFAELKVDPVMYAGLRGVPIPSGKLIAEGVGFNVYFRDWIYPRDLNFDWRGNLRLGLRGRNGSGKSTLLKEVVRSIASARGEPQGSPEARHQTRGTLNAGRMRVLYLDQRCEVLDDRLSILENVRLVSGESESQLRTALAKFLFTGESVFQKVSTLSGGERLRAALARGFLSAEKPELLILDEPTNNLDLGNVRFLETIVSGFKGGVLAVSHDEVFLEACGIKQFLELP